MLYWPELVCVLPRGLHRHSKWVLSMCWRELHVDSRVRSDSGLAIWCLFKCILFIGLFCFVNWSVECVAKWVISPTITYLCVHPSSCHIDLQPYWGHDLTAHDDWVGLLVFSPSTAKGGWDPVTGMRQLPKLFAVLCISLHSSALAWYKAVDTNIYWQCDDTYEYPRW